MSRPAPHSAAAPHSFFRVWFWLAVALLFIGFIALVRSILLPFVVGMMAAYFLDPAVRRLRSFGWSRGTAAAVITLVFFALAIGVCAFLVPLIIHQMTALLQNVPAYLERLQGRYSQDINHYLSLLSPDQVNTIKDSLGSTGTTLVGWGAQVAGGALRSGLALLNILSLIFITPIVAFYLLRDWHDVVSRFYALLPRNQADTISAQLHEVNNTLSGFIRGQTNVCLIMACYYGVLLSAIGLDSGLLIGLMTGLLLFIPLVGYATCLSLSVVIGLFQFQNTPHFFAVLAVYGAGLLLESSFLTPRLVGGKVGLHPLWVIFGMLAGGALFGFVGILISVPVTAVSGVLVRFAITRYLHSSLYMGETSATASSEHSSQG